MDDGIETNHGLIEVKLRAFVCDAPVRASLKCIISHSGYSSCERCTQHGEYHNSVVMPRTDCEARTDETFLLKSHPEHHKGVSPLEEIGFPMVSCFIIDYMHCCCIGVMKRILLRLQSSHKNHTKKVHFGSQQKLAFNAYLDKIREKIPSDFSRRLEGGIENISHWKASEMRLFLLYIGIVIFASKEIIPTKIRVNIQYFSTAMRLLLLNGQSKNVKFIEFLMKTFVEDAASLYGTSFVSYNVHNLIHLHDDYYNFGNLNNISAFPFESFLGTQIKGIAMGGFKPLQQISQHVTKLNLEVDQVDVSKSVQAYGHIKECIHDMPGNCFKSLKLRQNMTVKVISCLNGRDSAVQTVGGDIGIIHAIHNNNNKNHILLQLFEKSDLYTKPLASSKVGVHKLQKLATCKFVTSEEIFGKLIIVPYKKKFIGQVLLHSRE